MFYKGKMTKRCPYCTNPKLLSEFSKNTCAIDGLQSICKEHNKEHYEKNKKIILKKAKEYYLHNREKILKNTNQYYLDNKEKILKYQDDNKVKIAIRRKKYADENRKKINFYQRNKKQTNINFKISSNLRNRIYNALKRNEKSLPTMFLIGCEIDYFMYHIQEQFTDGMSWDNYGDWHMDHIKSCSKFDLSDTKQQLECFNYTNLQPLWAEDNLSKGNK